MGVNPEPPPHAQRLGSYQLLEQIGRGAMGAVYRARDLRTGRDVALKVPQVDAGGAKRLERMRREGQATAALDHPHVLRIHELGQEGGIPYLVYELIEGARSFDEVAPSLPLRRRVELVRDAARAMGHAHARGVLHRDLKPDNILIDRAGNLKVADFGLARIVGLEALTMTGAMVGTPVSMAPEQVNGQRERFGPPTDVWALGVLLYHTLTGELPFAGESLVSLAAAIHHETPDLPSALVPGLAPALDAVCRRALAKDPSERYPHGDGLADALDECLALAELTGVARRRWPLLAAGAAVLLLAGLVAALAGRGPATEGPAPTKTARSKTKPRQDSGARKKPADAPQLTAPVLRTKVPQGIYFARWFGEQVLTCENVQARLWNLDGTVAAAWSWGIAPAALAVAPDRSSFLVWGSDRFVWIDPKATKPRFVGKVAALGRVRALAPHPREARVAAGLTADVVVLELTDPPRVRRRLARTRAETSIVALAWSPDGERLLVGRGFTGPAALTGSGVGVWDVARNEQVNFHPTLSRPRGLAWAPGGKQFAVATSDGEVHLLSRDGRLEHKFKGKGVKTRPMMRAGQAHDGTAQFASFSPDGGLLVTGGNKRPPRIGGEVRAWDVTARTERGPAGLPRLFRFGRTLAPTFGLEVSPDGRHVLWAENQSFEVWALPAAKGR